MSDMNDGRFITTVFGGGLLLLLLIGGCNAYYVYGTAFTETVTVEERFVRLRGGDSGGQVYMVTATDGRSFEVSDSTLRWHFRSTDVWTSMREGGTYRIHGYGWRMPFFSTFPNIYKAEAAQ